MFNFIIYLINKIMRIYQSFISYFEIFVFKHSFEPVSLQNTLFDVSILEVFVSLSLPVEQTIQVLEVLVIHTLGLADDPLTLLFLHLLFLLLGHLLLTATRLRTQFLEEFRVHEVSVHVWLQRLRPDQC